MYLPALDHSNLGISVLYPSSVAVVDRPGDMTEYAMAKSAGEILCADLERSDKRFRILVERLPRMLTDQTAEAVIPAKAMSPVEVHASDQFAAWKERKNFEMVPHGDLKENRRFGSYERMAGECGIFSSERPQVNSSTAQPTLAPRYPDRHSWWFPPRRNSPCFLEILLFPRAGFPTHNSGIPITDVIGKTEYWGMKNSTPSRRT